MTVATEPSSHAFEEASAVSAETLLTDTSQDDELPTIELSASSSTEFHVNSIEIHHQNDLQGCATAITVAELVADTVRDPGDLEEGYRTRIPASHFANRAEFVSATFIKDDESPEKLGFNLHKRNNTITSITAGSLASCSPLQVGDKIFSINKKRCSGMSSVQICKYLQNLGGRVTVVVHNKGGSATFVESMVTKNHPRERCGLVLKRVGNSQLVVSNIRPDKVFIDSLLNVGDEVLTINGISCHHLSPEEAANIIKQTPKDVTVVVRRLLGTAVVVAELTTRDLGASSSPFSLSPGRLQLDLRGREGIPKEGLGVTRERAACVLFALVGIIVALSFIVAAQMRKEDGVYYTHNEATNSNSTTYSRTGCSLNGWGFDCNDTP